MNKEIEKIRKALETMFPVTFSDSYTGLMSRGVREEWGIRMIKPEEEAIVMRVMEVVNSLIKDEEETKPKGKTK